MLKSLIPALAMKCMYYQTSRETLRDDRVQTITELHTKGYLGRWWEGSFKINLMCFGFVTDKQACTPGCVTGQGVVSSQLGAHTKVGALHGAKNVREP